MRDEIILIGPIGAGKSTVGDIIARRLGLPQVEMDDLRYGYYNEIGYDREHADYLRKEGGLNALVEYWKPFELHAVKRLLADYQNCVIGFGAGHSVQEDADRFAELQSALRPFSNVVLLQPSPDVEASIRTLNAREEWMPQAEDMNRHFLTHLSNRAITKHIVYTGQYTAEQVADDVLACAPMHSTPWRAQIAQLRAAQTEFAAVCTALPANLHEQPGACGDWSPRQVVAHLAGWPREAARRFGELLAEPNRSVDYDVDDSNARWVAERQNMTWDETLADLNGSHRELLLATARVTDAVLAQTTAFEDWLRGTSEDLAFHGAQLRAWAVQYA